MNPRLPALLLFISCLVPASLLGHARGENYIFTNYHEDSITGEFQFGFDDIERVFDVAIVEGSENALALAKETAPRIREYVEANFSIGPEGGEPYTIEWGDVKLVGAFAAYHFRMESGPIPDVLTVRHEMMYEDDRFHRGLLLVQYNAKTGIDHGEEYTAMVFGPTNTEQTLDLLNVPGLVTPGEMVAQGVLHIWIGIDHILFLLTLILPTVLIFSLGAWQPVPQFRNGLWNLLKIVTVFTLAHSATLLLAALGILNIPSRFVESMIALSIILVALNNLTMHVKAGSLWIILFLGLFHGLGFASVMGHLPFRMNSILKSVIGFNVGVELGQIAIVLVVFPLLFLLRRNSLYVPVVLKGGSTILGLVATYWFVQRAFALG
jgi:hypothetical protein